MKINSHYFGNDILQWIPKNGNRDKEPMAATSLTANLSDPKLPAALLNSEDPPFKKKQKSLL